jgi:hypothetical protein
MFGWCSGPQPLRGPAGPAPCCQSGRRHLLARCYISATELTVFRHKLGRSYRRTSVFPTASCERATPRFVAILAAMTDTASVISLFFKAYVRLRNRVSSVTRLGAGLSRKLSSIPETDKKFLVSKASRPALKLRTAYRRLFTRHSGVTTDCRRSVYRLSYRRHIYKKTITEMRKLSNGKLTLPPL